jgi:hypothetical protein
MRTRFAAAMAICLLTTYANAADCEVANCNERSNPGSCDRAQAAYRACINGRKAKPPKDPRLGQQTKVPEPAVSNKKTCAGCASTAL